MPPTLTLNHAGWLCKFDFTGKHGQLLGIVFPVLVFVQFGEDAVQRVGDDLQKQIVWVPANKRKVCVKRINEFRKKFLLRLFVTCRFIDYKEIGDLLEVDYVFQVQPLSTQQVASYLSGEDRLSELSKGIATDNRLSELAQSPLMLRILIAIPNAVSLPGSQTPLTALQLFKTYVVSQFCSRRRHAATPKQIIKTLHTLAAEFQEQSLSIFYPEDLNHKFLKSGRSRRLFWLATIGFLAAPFSFVVVTARQAGFFTWASEHWILGPIFGIAFVSLSGWSLVKASTAKKYRAHDALVLSPLRGIKGAGIGVACGSSLVVLHAAILLAILLLIALFVLVIALGAWLGWWVFVVVGIGIILLIFMSDEPGQRLQAIILGPTLVSLLLLAISGFSFWLSGLDQDAGVFNLSLLIDFLLFLGRSAIREIFPDAIESLAREGKQLWSTWLVFAGSWAIAGLIAGCFGGMFRMPNRKHSVKPAKFLFYATLNSVLIGIAAPLAFLSIVIVCHKLAHTHFRWELGYGQVAVLVSFVGFLALGGFEAFVHIVIRLLLAAERQLSFRLISTLTDCTELIFIRRIGGGYNFLHASEMAFFAGLSDGEIRELEGEVEAALV